MVSGRKLMKTENEIDQEIEEIIQAHYYSEDYDLEWSIRNYRDQLSADEQSLFDDLLVKRLTDDPSIVHITFCARITDPRFVPLLCDLLDKETAISQRSRALIAALRHYRHPEVFRAVERFVDSDQEREAITCLAAVDFDRFRPYFIRAMNKDHLRDTCLHILHAHKKRIGLHPLSDLLREWTKTYAAMSADRLGVVLDCKQGEYNPFSIDEIKALKKGIAKGRE